MTSTMIRAGQLLLAEPFLLDPNFRRAAVALVDHHLEGTVGFVLNQLTLAKVTDLLSDFPDFAGQVFLGGPVQQDSLHYLHVLGDYIPDSQPIIGDLCWGGDFGQLTELVSIGVANETNLRFFLGYSGWSPGQLEEECAEKTWMSTQLTPDLLFATAADQVWPKAIKRLGNTYTVIGDMEVESLN